MEASTSALRSARVFFFFLAELAATASHDQAARIEIDVKNNKKAHQMREPRRLQQLELGGGQGSRSLPARPSSAERRVRRRPWLLLVGASRENEALSRAAGSCCAGKRKS